MSSSEESEIEAKKVRMKASGELVQRIDGTETTVAHYDRATGHLEFETKEHSVKLYNQITAKIGTVKNGTERSGLVIRSIGVKGQPKQASTGSKRPKMREEGDGTPEVVDWYIRNNLPEAIIRYGIYTDSKGNPIRKHVQRTVEVVMDGRNDPAKPTPMPVVGQSHEGGPVQRKRVTINVRNAIIARRATRYEDNEDVLADLGVDKLEALFIPQETVGGFQPDDEFEEANTLAEVEE